MEKFFYLPAENQLRKICRKEYKGKDFGGLKFSRETEIEIWLMKWKMRGLDENKLKKMIRVFK